MIQGQQVAEQKRRHKALEEHASRVQDEMERAQGWREDWKKYIEAQRQFEKALEQRRKDVKDYADQFWKLRDQLFDPGTQELAEKYLQMRYRNPQWNPAAPSAPGAEEGVPSGTPAPAGRRDMKQTLEDRGATTSQDLAKTMEGRFSDKDLDLPASDLVKTMEFEIPREMAPKEGESVRAWFERVGIGGPGSETVEEFAEEDEDEMPPAAPGAAVGEEVDRSMEVLAQHLGEASRQMAGPDEPLAQINPLASAPQGGQAMLPPGMPGAGQPVTAIPQGQMAGAGDPNVQAQRAQVAQTPGGWMVSVPPGQAPPNVGVTPDGTRRGPSPTLPDQQPLPPAQGANVPMPGMPLAAGSQVQMGPDQQVVQGAAAATTMPQPGMSLTRPADAAVPDFEAMQADGPGIPPEDAIAPPGTLSTYTAPDGQQYTFDWGKLRRSTIAWGRKAADDIANNMPGADRRAMRALKAGMPDVITAFGGNKAAALEFMFDKILNPAAQRETSRINARQAAIAASKRGGAGRDTTVYMQAQDDAERWLNSAGRDYGKNMEARRELRQGISDLKSNNGTRQWNAIKRMVKSLESGRLSDFDVQMGEGLKSWLTKAQDFWERGTRGKMSNELRDQLLGAYAASLKATTHHLRQTRLEMLEEIRGARLAPERAAWKKKLDSAFRRFDWHHKAKGGVEIWDPESEQWISESVNVRLGGESAPKPRPNLPNPDKSEAGKALDDLPDAR